MSRTRLTLLAGASGLTLILAGCEGGLPFVEGTGGGTEASASAARPAADRVVERDIEAPDVFQKTEKGLWDGRPSLGGVWVAHPDVDDPERVMIRNETNGKFVVGALFRRERDMPGPGLQVSSDAAAALGLVAGAPTMLNVTALRRETETAEPEPEALAATGSDAPVTDVREARTIDAPETVAATALKPARGTVESAAAAIDAAEVEAETGAAAAQAADGAGIAPAEGKARKGGFLAGLFKPRGKAPASALKDDALVDPAAAGTEITERTLEPTPASATASEAPEPAEAPARASGSGGSVLQIGIFSQQENAERTAELLRRNGVVPTVAEVTSNGKTYWRVTAGPAKSRGDQNALKRKVRGLGFPDAYIVSG